MPHPRDTSVEAILARLYADAALIEQFLEQPEGVGCAFGLTASEARQLADSDAVGLRFAAASFAAKRQKKESHRPSWRRLFSR